MSNDDVVELFDCPPEPAKRKNIEEYEFSREKLLESLSGSIPKKYFELQKLKQDEDEKRWVCKVPLTTVLGKRPCGHSFSAATSITNLRAHLVDKHKQNEFIVEFTKLNESLVQQTLNFPSREEKEKIWTAEDLCLAFNELIWENNVAFSVCDSKPWKRIFTILKMEPISSYLSKTDLLNRVSNEKKLLRDFIHKDVRFLTGTSDETKGKNDLQLSCHCVCYCDKNLKMINVVLSIHHCTSKSNVNQSAMWKKTCEELGIKMILHYL